MFLLLLFLLFIIIIIITRFPSSQFHDIREIPPLVSRVITSAWIYPRKSSVTFEMFCVPPCRFLASGQHITHRHGDVQVEAQYNRLNARRLEMVSPITMPGHSRAYKAVWIHWGLRLLKNSAENVRRGPEDDASGIFLKEGGIWYKAVNGSIDLVNSLKRLDGRVR